VAAHAEQLSAPVWAQLPGSEPVRRLRLWLHMETAMAAKKTMINGHQQR